jgi:hypothetical protein
VLLKRRQRWPQGRGRARQTPPAAAFFSLGRSQASNPPGQTQGRTTVAMPLAKPLPREPTPKSTKRMSVEGEQCQSAKLDEREVSSLKKGSLAVSRLQEGWSSGRLLSGLGGSRARSAIRRRHRHHRPKDLRATLTRRALLAGRLV